MNNGWGLIDRDELLAELQRVFDAQTAEVLLRVLDRVAAQVRQVGATREDFRELKQIVVELAGAQRHTAEEMKELVAAQARTEERAGRMETAMERLAEAQARTDERVGHLETAMERMAEAQAHTDERVGHLETAMERLAEAQRQMSVAVSALAEKVEHLSKQVGGLSDMVGGDIEDIAYIVLYDVLKREFGWQVGVLERSWQRWNGKLEEVNIFGMASDPARPERTIWIVGEAKHNLTAKEVERFVRQVGRARRHLAGEVFPVCFCYRARPEVQQMVLNSGIRLVFSYGKLV